MRYRATVSSKNQVTLPADVRKKLGIGAGSKIDFVVDDEGVHIEPARNLTVADLYGSIPALPNTSADFEREIDEAMAAEADHIIAEMARP